MEGLWPGVAAVVGDADFWCPDCARARYGNDIIDGLINGTLPEWIRRPVEQVAYKLVTTEIAQQYYAMTGDTQGRLFGQKGLTWMKEYYPKCVQWVEKDILNPLLQDQEGNLLTVVLNDAEDLHGQYCAGGYGPIEPGDCHQEPYELCSCGCDCYGEGRYEHWNQYGSWPEEEEDAS
jgi:hypothetical protein